MCVVFILVLALCGMLNCCFGIMWIIIQLFIGIMWNMCCLPKDGRIFLAAGKEISVFDKKFPTSHQSSPVCYKIHA